MRQLLLRISLVSASLFLLPLSNLITTPIISRLLGPSGKGELVLILQPMTIVDSIAVVGIGSYLLAQSRLNDNFSANRADLISPLILGNFLGLFFLIYWYEVSISSKIADSKYVLLCYALLPVGSWIAIHKVRLIIDGNIRPSILESSMNAVLRTLIIIMYYFLEVKNSSIIALSFILIGILSGIFCIRPPSIKRQLLDSSNMNFKKLAPPSLSMWIFDILSVASVRLDQIILSIVYSTSQLGLYSVALVVAEIPLIGSNSVARELINKNRESHQRGRNFIISAEITFLSMCLLAFVGTNFIPAIFGEKFKEAVPMSQLLIVGIYFQMHSQLVSTYMLLNGLASKRYLLNLFPILTMLLGILYISLHGLEIYIFIGSFISGWIISFIYGLLTLCYSRKSVGSFDELI